jgi:hypothetical protein
MSTNIAIDKLTADELVDSFIFPQEISKEEKKRADKELSEARKRNRATLPKENEILLKLMQLRYRLENYIQHEPYDPRYTFSYFLSQYLNILDIKRKDFAKEIDIHETLLSQLMNDRREPNERVMVRLEIHSNNVIPALHWLKLVEKGKEHFIRTNASLRKREGRFVKKNLSVRV